MAMWEWQPYLNDPQVSELVHLLADLSERALEALLREDSTAFERLLQEREVIQSRLGERTVALLRDESRRPRWVSHTAADAIPCLACGNIPAGESRCCYCGWTYVSELPDRA